MAFPTLKQIEEYNTFQNTWYERMGKYKKGSKIPNIREYFERKGGVPLAKKNKLKIKKA